MKVIRASFKYLTTITRSMSFNGKLSDVFPDKEILPEFKKHSQSDNELELYRPPKPWIILFPFRLFFRTPFLKIHMQKDNGKITITYKSTILPLIMCIYIFSPVFIIGTINTTAWLTLTLIIAPIGIITFRYILLYIPSLNINRALTSKYNPFVGNIQ